MTHAPFDPFAADFIRDPYSTYARLRVHPGTVRSVTGAWVLSTYEDVAWALRHASLRNAPSLYSVLHARNAGKYVCASVANNILPFRDGPRHRAARSALAKIFGQHTRRLRDPSDRFLMEYIEANETLDVVKHYARPIAIRITSEIMGFAAEDESFLGECSNAFFGLFAPQTTTGCLDATERVVHAFRDYVRTVVRARRAAPRADLVSEGVALGSLEEDELVDNCLLLFADGVENVAHGVGNAVAALCRHPRALIWLRENPGAMATAVEELLRYDSPAQAISRVAQEDLTWRDQRIRANQPLTLLLGSANRDPRVFERADQLVLSRVPNPHLTFGRGAHGCLGGGFATLQTTWMLGGLLRALPEWHVVGAPRRVARLGHSWHEGVCLVARSG